MSFVSLPSEWKNEYENIKWLRAEYGVSQSLFPIPDCD